MSIVSFPVSDFGTWPDIECLEKQIGKNALEQPVLSIGIGIAEAGRVDFLFADPASPSDTATLSAIVAGHDLVKATADKVKAIDARTNALIDLGFQHAGMMFSLSIPAQSKMTAAHQIKDHPMFAYPVEWNSITDEEVYSIASADDMDFFYLTAIGTIRVRLDSGTALKGAVRAATSVAEVDAVEDPR